MQERPETSIPSSHPTSNIPLIVFDTETTGLRENQICQLAYLIVTPDEVIGKNFFFTVDDMNSYAQEVHGFSREQLRRLSNGQRFEDKADEIHADFKAVDLVVGHNVSYDVKQIRDSLKRTGIKYSPKKTLCTMVFFTPIMKLVDKQGKKKPPKLNELRRHFGLTERMVSKATQEIFRYCGKAHDARFDAVATYLCLVEANKTGQLKGLLR